MRSLVRPFSTRVSNRSKVLVILVTWLLATGVQWDVVQTIGWVRMFANYSRVMSISQAAKATFGGEMCGICRTVDAARKAESDKAPPRDVRDERLIFVVLPMPGFFGPAAQEKPWSLCEQDAPDASRAAPPTPPPRA
jgi:hypothetical protein